LPLDIACAGAAPGQHEAMLQPTACQNTRDRLDFKDADVPPSG